MPLGKGTVSAKLTQPDSLRVMAEMVHKGSIDPLVRTVALQIIQSSGCGQRDDDCELHAIYDAVKHGHPKVPALREGFLYVNDPRYADYFTSAPDSLRACLKGACGGDCDDATILIASLAASVGWLTGMRGWGDDKDQRLNGTGGGSMIHVYPVVAYPKRPMPMADYGGQVAYSRAVGLDATVPEAYVGWEPPRSSVCLTAWCE